MLLRYLLRPLETTSLLAIALFTFGFTLGLGAGLYGIIMTLLMMSWFFKYAYVLLDATANGIEEPPTMAAEMLNPVEQRPLMQLVICCGVGWLVYRIGGMAGVAVGVLALLYLPASVAVMGASARAIDAVNPVALTRVVLGLGNYYVLILAVIAVYAFGILVLAQSGLPLFVQILFINFAIFSIFALLGGALYERRHVLGYEPTHTPERKAERAERERSRERAHALDVVYGEARGGNFLAARESLLNWIRHNDPDWLERDVRFFFSEARTWQDEKAFVFLSRFLISQLLEMGKNGAAIEIVSGVLERAPTLKLGTAGDTVKIATLARAAGRRSLALRVLTPFETQFPGDALTSEVAAMRAQLER